MADENDLAGKGAGWIVAAIVAAVAICAVSFMVTQRPRAAMAVAEGDPLTGEILRVPQTAAGPATGPPAVHAQAARTTDAAVADTAAVAQAAPSSAMDANTAGSNASTVETAR
jgi:hypothetical protein